MYSEFEDHTDIEIANEAEMVALAARVEACCGAGDVVALHGNLGVGKSVFARAFIQTRFGFDTEVPSPTFTLVQYYEGDADPVYHFDLYRLESENDVLELGFEDACYDGSVLIEWPAKAGAYLPKDRLEVEIFAGKSANERLARLTGQGYWRARVADVINDGKIHA